MKSLSRLLLTSSSIAALLACLFILVYNHVGMMVFAKDDILKALLIDFVKLQWLALTVPFTGFVAALATRKSTNYILPLLLSQCLFLFAFVWPLIGITLWQVEQIKIIN